MMFEITVISGKGGTGKTSLTGAFAALSEDKIICDLDVDAANLHLLLNPEVKKEEEFFSGKKAIVNEEKCISCGLCQKNCNFKAIKVKEKAVISDNLCEGCGVCAYVCPADAIDLEDNYCGDWFVSETRFGSFFHARMKPGEENSGKLVTLLRNKSKEAAKEKRINLVLSDGSPGTGCPVISSITGTNLALIVVEPTLSGIHDGKRAAELCGHFSIPCLVIINKFDMNKENSELIEKIFSEMDIPVIGKVPVSKIFVEAMVAKKTVIECDDELVKKEISQIWEEVLKRVKK